MVWAGIPTGSILEPRSALDKHFFRWYMIRWAIPALLATLLSVAVAAQTAPSVLAGERVRISAPAHGIDSRVGSVVAWTADTLIVQWDGGGDAAFLPASSVRMLAVSHGSHRGRLRRGLMGAAGGALATAGVIWVAVHTSDDPSAELFGLIYGQVLVPAGALVGGVGGALTAPVRERWRPVSLGVLDRSGLGGEAAPLARRARVRVVAPAVLDRPVTGEVLDARRHADPCDRRRRRAADPRRRCPAT